MKRGTLIALGAFAVLLVLVFATHEPRVSVGVHKLEPVTLDPARVTALELSGARAAVLRKESGRWFVSAPEKPDVKHPADTALVAGALERLKEVRHPDFVTDRAERHAELEVDDAKGLKVKVVQEGGPAVEYVLGKASRNGGVYLRQPGRDDVFAQPGPLDWSVRKDLKDWRQRRVMDLAVEDVSKLVLHAKEGGRWTLEAGAGDGAWKLVDGTTPEGFRFDGQAARRFVQQLASLHAQDFLDADAAKAAEARFSGAHDRVEVQLKEGRKWVLQLDAEPGEADGTVAARVEGETQVYLLAAASAARLRPRLEEFRDLRLLDFEPGKVTRLLLQVGGQRVVAVKDGGAWKLTEPARLPEGFDFEPAQVDARLSWLRDLRGTRLIDGAVTEAASGLASPSTHVELTLEGAPPRRLWLGKAVPGAREGSPELYARGSVDGFTYAVSESVREQLAKGVELFKRRPPPSLQGLESLPPELRRQLEEQLRAASQ
ncbi:DUF4340 domain-containing protein [Myxococcus stipitatus]|uniref:DUF4340 domain-containing protein n=1 Tax=Myxococcus stipitatus TaxID=83455 RepID=UPI00314523E1